MSDLSRNPGNKQIIYFFLGFVIFFAFSFSLGVIVGKQIGKSRDSSFNDVSKHTEIESGPGGDITDDGQETFLFEKTETINGNGIGTENRPVSNEKASGVAVETKETETDGSASRDQKVSDTEEIDNTRKELKSLPPIDPEGIYTVQVGSFQDEKAALQYLNSLKLKRYPASVKRVVISGYGASYRVRIGTFGTRDKANLYGENLKRLEPNIKSVYITTNN